MGTFFLLLGTVLWIALAFWPAYIAKKKGYSFILFLILSWLISWILTLIIALVLRDKTQTAQDRADDKAAEIALEKDEDKT